jgi:ABC-type multidrug transport system fused ATPase/permease subunit
MVYISDAGILMQYNIKIRSIVLKTTIRAILSVVNQKEKKRLALFILFNTIINLADVFSVVCLLFVIKYYTQPFAAGHDVPLLSKLFPGKNAVLPVLILIVMFIVKNIAGHLVYKKQVKFVSNIAVRLSRQNLSGYLEGPYHDYTNIDSAILVRKIIHQPTEFAQYVLQAAQQIITEVLLITFSITALMIYNGKLFMIVFLTMLPAIIMLSWITKKRLEKIKKNIKSVVEKSLQYLNEALKGYVESNIYDKNSFFINRHKEAQQTVGDHIAGMQTLQDLPARIFEVFAILGLFVLIVAIKYATAINNADVVIVGAFMAAAYKIIPSISKIINLARQVETYRYTIEGTINHSPEQQKKVISAQKIESIEFRNINFSYERLQVLEEFNCSITAGSFIGLSGDSGSGKSTILQLLLGFYRPGSGNILFNGKVADCESRISHWNQIAYVKQEPFILHDSILNNITLFENEYNGERLKEILEITGIQKVADQFPEGIHQQIMEAGKNLSGGQRKRLAIARALYKDAGLILLDEPFSELDELSELKILRYLKQLALAGKTIVLISHSRNSFQLCDTIINVYPQEQQVFL